MSANAQPFASKPHTRAVKSAVKDQPLVAQRRERLIAAAIQIFKEKGFAAATVRDIGRKAGMTQGTIYNYVASKDDVLYLVCDHLVSKYQEQTRRALTESTDPVQRIWSSARAVAEVVYDHQDEILLIYQNTHLLDARSLRVILHRVEGFVRIFEDLIAGAALEAGVTVPNAFFAANILTYLPTMIALRRWSLKSDQKKEDLLDELADFLARGLGFLK